MGKKREQEKERIDGGINRYSGSFSRTVKLDSLGNILAWMGEFFHSFLVCVLRRLMSFVCSTPTARMNDFISKRLITNKPTPIGVDAPSSSTSMPASAIISFELDATSLQQIESATKEFADHVAKYSVHYLNYGRYGKDGIKSMKTSPDGWYVPTLLKVARIELMICFAGHNKSFNSLIT